LAFCTASILLCTCYYDIEQNTFVDVLLSSRRSNCIFFVP